MHVWTLYLLKYPKMLHNRKYVRYLLSYSQRASYPIQRSFDKGKDSKTKRSEGIPNRLRTTN